MSPLDCPLCRKPIGLMALLSNLCGQGTGPANFTSRCPECRGYIEFQVRSRKIVLGFTYWSGAMHFEGMIDVPVSGLTLDASTQPPSLRHAGITYTIKPEPPPTGL